MLRAKKYAKHWLSLRIVTYLIEYLGEFEFIFETILDYESGEQVGSFDAKKPPTKISCLGPFKGAQGWDFRWRFFCINHV